MSLGADDTTNVPALAIAAFERLTELHICIHDASRSLWPFLSPDRFEHLNPLCRSIKTLRQPACTAFDAELIRERAGSAPAGLVKVCHAGLVEWVVPLIVDGTLQWTIFAGVRRPGPGLERIVADPSPLLRGGPWSAQVASLPAVDDEAAAWILESLRQLGERLAAWAREHGPHERQTPLPRATTIRHFIIRQHADPTVSLHDLAQLLGLSDSRAGHAVRDACGRTFIELLTETRLRTAAGLLRHTGLPLEQIAAQSGFGNRSHFHAQFRRTFGMSPGKYRQTPRES